MLHLLVANVGNHNAVIISQKTIAKVLGITDRTVRAVVADLEAGSGFKLSGSARAVKRPMSLMTGWRGRSAAIAYGCRGLAPK